LSLLSLGLSSRCLGMFLLLALKYTTQDWHAESLWRFWNTNCEVYTVNLQRAWPCACWRHEFLHNFAWTCIHILWRNYMHGHARRVLQWGQFTVCTLKTPSRFCMPICEVLRLVFEHLVIMEVVGVVSMMMTKAWWRQQ